MHQHDNPAPRSESLLLIATDLNGTVTMCNTIAQSVLGYTLADIMGKPIPVEAFETHKAAIIKAPNTAQTLTFRSQTGDPLSMTVSTSCITNPKDQIQGLLFKALTQQYQTTTLDCNTLPSMPIFELVLERELKRMQRTRQPLGLIKIDVDHFRQFRKNFGTEQAKRCLDQIAFVLDKRIRRAGDLLAFGGIDEFYILLPNTDQPGTVTVSERLRLLVEELGIVTISLGIVAFTPEPSHQKYVLFAKLEEAVKKAKQAGRNCSRVLDLNADPETIPE